MFRAGEKIDAKHVLAACNPLLYAFILVGKKCCYENACLVDPLEVQIQRKREICKKVKKFYLVGSKILDDRMYSLGCWSPLLPALDRDAVIQI